MERDVVGRVPSIALVGLDAVGITVEAHVGPGLPGLHIIGSLSSAAREASGRVRTALSAAGLTFPNRKALVSLAPAEVPKAGARFDLPIALALAAELGEVPVTALEATAVLGELALDATTRAVPGVLPSVAILPALGVDRVLVPDANAPEAALVDGVDAVPVGDLREAIAVLRGERPARRPDTRTGEVARILPDLADVRGQAEARRALEIAAAGGHHLLLVGPPGCGKSMLATRLPSLLPPLSQAQALEVAAIRSVAGAFGDGDVLDVRPPFRAPHHTTTAAALIGGGSGIAKPGVLSLAHHGVLFLDELFEWPRSLLEALREPLQEGVVRVARSQATVRYPARVQLVCAANPCPCGGGVACACTDEQIWSYRSRLSGPLADRLDLAPAVEPLSADDLIAVEPGEPSATVARRVAAARRWAAERWGADATNATASAALLRRTVRPRALRRLAATVEEGLLTGRGFDRALRVARTCADLEGQELVGEDQVLEALAHRLQLRPRQLAGR